MPSSAVSDRRRGPALRRPRDSGQAAVELALCLPVVLLVLLGVVQVAVVVRGELVVQHAAREGARAASVSAAPAAAANGAVDAALAEARLDRAGATTSVGTGRVRVTVRAVTRTDVPLVGSLIGDVTHRATVVMVLEPP
jgi:Flp pilus assembly protein TadG